MGYDLSDPGLCCGPTRQATIALRGILAATRSITLDPTVSRDAVSSAGTPPCRSCRAGPGRDRPAVAAGEEAGDAVGLAVIEELELVTPTEAVEQLAGAGPEATRAQHRPR